MDGFADTRQVQVFGEVGRVGKVLAVVGDVVDAETVGGEIVSLELCTGSELVVLDE